MSKVNGPWDDINENSPIEPEHAKRLATLAFAIDEDEAEAFRATFKTPAGQRTLDLLHRRFVDQARFDPNFENPVYAGFYNEGAAHVVQMMEAKARPSEGDQR